MGFIHEENTTSIQMSFPETVSDCLCRNSLVMQTDCCSSCLGGWSQTILEVKMLDVEVLGWCGYTWSAVVRPVGCTAKFYKTKTKCCVYYFVQYILCIYIITLITLKRQFLPYTIPKTPKHHQNRFLNLCFIQIPTLDVLAT